MAAPHAGSILHTILTTPDLPAFYQTQARQYEPATDDRPFFNHHTRWSSINWQTFKELFTHKKLGMLMLGDLPVAEISLLVLLAQTSFLAAALIFLPLVRFSREGLRVQHRWQFLLYFAALGFGFITIEMALLSHFTLFLGQPVYTYAVILASLLVFTGLGAHLAGRFTINPRRALLRIVPLLLAVLLVTALGGPLVFAAALGLDLWLRILIAVIVLAPLGILLGLPFPLGLCVVSEEAVSLVPWAWGINGFFTVIGTISALIIGMTFGFKAALLVGALSYLIALAAIKFRKGVVYVA